MSALSSAKRGRVEQMREEQETHRSFGSFCKQLSIISAIALLYLNLPPSRSSFGGSSRIVLLSAFAGG
jgi:hypothetical protein